MSLRLLVVKHHITEQAAQQALTQNTAHPAAAELPHQPLMALAAVVAEVGLMVMQGEAVLPHLV
jgi:hypothetical protein